MKGLLLKVKLGVSLWIAFGGLLLLSGIQGLAVVSSTMRMEASSQSTVGEITTLSDEVQQVAQGSAEASTQVQQLSTRLKKSVATGEDEISLMQRYMDLGVVTAEDAVAGLEELLDSPELDEESAGIIEDLLFDIEDKADRLRKEALPFFEVSVQRMEKAAQTTRQTTDEVAGLSEMMDEFVVKSQQAGERANTATAGTRQCADLSSTAKWMTIAGVSVSVLLGISIPLTIVPRINKEVGQAVCCLEAVAQGDLTQQFNAGAFAEFRRISSATNQAIRAMANAVIEIMEDSRRLSSSSTQLVETSNSLNKGADYVKQLAQDAGTASQEMSGAMDQVATSMQQVSETSTGIAADAHEMLTSLDEVAQSVQNAAHIAHSATELISTGSQQISQLGVAAKEIGAVSQVIQEITERTNLLALNATIEAARAGAAGKGFAVVATEVKELAQQTSEATESIRQRIDGIQQATDEAVALVMKIDDVIRAVCQESEQISSRVDGQSAITNRIAERIANAAQVAENVASNVAESAVTSREIDRAIAAVGGASVDTVDAAQLTRTSGDDLTEISRRMNEALSLFSTSA